MDCQYVEKVSAFIDGELEREEIPLLKQHLETCAVCKEAERVFLNMRGEMKAHLDAWPAGGEYWLRRILDPPTAPLWKRRIQVPVPVLAMTLVMLVTLGIWLISVRRKYQPPEIARVRPASTGTQATELSGFDLSRFDHGERAVLIKTKREEASPNKQ